LDDEGLEVLAGLTNFLIENNVSIYDFFGDTIYNQLVKTKKR
jgi:hypothetical protein